MKYLLILSILFTTVIYAETPFEKGEKIARQNEKAGEGYLGESSSMKMILKDAHGTETTRELSGKTLEVKNDGDKSLITFLRPADVKGTKMLTWAHNKDDDDQWLYLKSIKRVKRISSRSKSSSFMGSEFSYEDLGGQSPDKYKHKFIKDDSYNGRKVWVLERVPNGENSAYSKQVMWIDKEYNAPFKVDYYDRKGELLKTAIFSDYLPMKVSGKTFFKPKSVHMKNVQTLKESKFTWENRKLGAIFKVREFSQNSLKD